MSDLGSQVRKDVGDHLRRLRLSLGWTLTDVAEKASLDGIPVSASTVSRVERGITAIPAEVLSGLCRSLGTSLAHVEEIIRSAQVRELVDLGEQDDAALLAAGKERAMAGDVRAALVHLDAAHDWLIMQPSLADRETRLAEVLTWQSACYRRLHSFNMALAAAGRVLNMREISDDQRMHAVALHVEVGYITGDVYRARVFAAHARELMGRVTPRTRARAEMALGMLAFETERYDEALSHIEMARALYEQLALEIESARCQVTMGYCHHRLERPAGARRLIQQGRAIAEKGGYREVELYALATEGRLLADEGRLGEAEDFISRAGDLARRLDLSTQEFSAWFALYLAYRGAGMDEDRRRIAARLRRLLRRVTHQCPEVQRFVELEAPDEAATRRRIP